MQKNKQMSNVKRSRTASIHFLTTGEKVLTKGNKTDMQVPQLGRETNASDGNKNIIITN